MNSDFLKIHDIHRSFDGKKALSAINLNITKGEIFGVVGPDGCGKTTLLRILAGILSSDSGDILLNGRSLKDSFSEDSNSKIGYMPQRFALYPDLTLLENIIFYSEIYGINKKDQDKNIRDLLTSFSIYDFKDRKAGKLSGGMKQKLALACTLIHTPEILILDEPTNGVDPVSRREFWNILYNLREKGVTIITSTSYLEEAERCSHVALLYKGKVLAFNTVSQIKILKDFDMFTIENDNARKIYYSIKKKISIENLNLTGNRIKIFLKKDKKNDILKKLEKYFDKDQNFEMETPQLEDLFQFLVNMEEKNVI